jgi:hypothetical protein
LEVKIIHSISFPEKGKAEISIVKKLRRNIPGGAGLISDAHSG